MRKPSLSCCQPQRELPQNKKLLEMPATCTPHGPGPPVPGAPLLGMLCGEHCTWAGCEAGREHRAGCEGTALRGCWPYLLQHKGHGTLHITLPEARRGQITAAGALPTWGPDPKPRTIAAGPQPRCRRDKRRASQERAAGKWKWCSWAQPSPGAGQARAGSLLCSYLPGSQRFCPCAPLAGRGEAAGRTRREPGGASRGAQHPQGLQAGGRRGGWGQCPVLGAVPVPPSTAHSSGDSEALGSVAAGSISGSPSCPRRPLGSQRRHPGLNQPQKPKSPSRSAPSPTPLHPLFPRSPRR